MLCRVEARLAGKVQGVFLRSAIKKYAAEHGLGGFVKNRYDGTVVVVAEGDRAKVEALLVWLQTNPGQSQISDRQQVWSDCLKPLAHFEIR